jgi:hypothetical protein
MHHFTASSRRGAFGTAFRLIWVMIGLVAVGCDIPNTTRSTVDEGTPTPVKSATPKSENPTKTEGKPEDSDGNTTYQPKAPEEKKEKSDETENTAQREKLQQVSQSSAVLVRAQCKEPKEPLPKTFLEQTQAKRIVTEKELEFWKTSCASNATGAQCARYGFLLAKSQKIDEALAVLSESCFGGKSKKPQECELTQSSQGLACVLGARLTSDKDQAMALKSCACELLQCGECATDP